MKEKPKTRKMCYVIVTARSLIWLLLSLFALLTMLSALMGSSWLNGPTRITQWQNITTSYQSSEGVFTRCKPMSERMHCGPFAIRGLATDDIVFPAVWKASMVFIALGLSILCVTVFSGIFSFCFQSIFKKSIFTLSGATQAVAGMFFILGVMLHPMGWGTHRVQRLCGKDASPFYPGDCTIGWNLYFAVIATVLTFVCACLSVPAEKATSSDKVQDKIQEGQVLICLA